MREELRLLIAKYGYPSVIEALHKEYLLYPQRKIYKVIRESGGWESFSFKIIEHLDQSNDIHFREKYWIAHFKPRGNSISPPNTLIL